MRDPPKKIKNKLESNQYHLASKRQLLSLEKMPLLLPPTCFERAILGANDIFHCRLLLIEWNQGRCSTKWGLSQWVITTDFTEKRFNSKGKKKKRRIPESEKTSFNQLLFWSGPSLKKKTRVIESFTSRKDIIVNLSCKKWLSLPSPAPTSTIVI